MFTIIFWFGGNRTFAVDGQVIHFDLSVNKNVPDNEKFPLSANGKCLKGTLGAIVDAVTYIPYGMELSNKSEMAIILHQLDTLKFRRNDLFIFDRYYFSYSLFKKIDSLNCKSLFRVKKNAIPAEIKKNWKITAEALYAKEKQKKEKLK